MSSATVTFRSDFDNDYAVDARGSFEKITKQNRRPSYRRSSSPPGSVNGIHKRRNSRWTWGHGRGASLQNIRSVARCVIAAVATLYAATAAAGPLGMDFVTVGNPGNTGKFVSGTAGSGTFGAVSSTFDIGKTEVNNSNYTAFLNAVAASDPYALYNTQMSNSIGGITRSGSSGSFTYAVKAGWGDKPVNYVNVYSAARFVNWLNNGMPTVSGSVAVNGAINTGAYSLANSTLPNTALVRNPGATYFLPTRDEWFKAAYYSQTLNSGTGGYYTYATTNNSIPTISGTAADTSSNAAYYANLSSAGPMDVNGLANSVSPYGALGMFGNMAEWLQNSTSTQAYWVGGWYTMPLSGPTGVATYANSNSFAGALQSNNAQSGSQGFRIAAVPEPSTVMLAVLGVVTVSGGEIARRRRKERKAASAPTA